MQRVSQKHLMGIFVKLADMCGKLKIRINLTSTYLRQAQAYRQVRQRVIAWTQAACFGMNKEVCIEIKEQT